jgi:hypothetical protein
MKDEQVLGQFFIVKCRTPSPNDRTTTPIIATTKSLLISRSQTTPLRTATGDGRDNIYSFFMFIKPERPKASSRLVLVILNIRISKELCKIPMLKLSCRPNEGVEPRHLYTVQS